MIVVGAGLPHLPAVLSASKSYSERLFSYQRIDRLSREESDRALTAPAAEEDAAYDDEALAAMYDATGGYPYFIQAYGKTVWDLAPALAHHRRRRRGGRARGRARAGGRASSAAATSGPRRASGTTCGRWPTPRGSDEVDDPVGSVATADVAAYLGKKPQSLSPARDSLLKKGLIYSGERGRIAFTVPHFGRYLRASRPSVPQFEEPGNATAAQLRRSCRPRRTAASAGSERRERREQSASTTTPSARTAPSRWRP